MVRKTVETTTTTTISLRRVRKLLGLPKWGRLSIEELLVRNTQGVWAPVFDALPSMDGMKFKTYQSRTTVRGRP